MLRWKATGGTVVMVLLAIVTASSTLQTPPVLTLDEKTLREYTGVYRWGPNSFVYLQLWNEFIGFDKPAQLVSIDETGEARYLYPTGRDQFFTGPGIALPTSIQSRIHFQRDGTGKIASLTSQREGGAPRVGERVEIEKREEVRFSNGSVRLVGTLTSPTTA
jgi:hypothetical protein